MRLEDVLKSRGMSDDDLETLKPLLDNAKARQALEAEIADKDAKIKAADDDLEKWSKWHQETALPTLDKALKNEQEARAEAAAHAARLKAMQEQGLARIADEQDRGAGRRQEPDQPAFDSSKFDPKAFNLVTHDDVVKFADAEGRAIAMVQDLAAEHYELFGKPLKGVTALRDEALAAKKEFGSYAREKLGFDKRRQEIADREREKRESEIRAEERTKVIAELANPMARPPSASRNPFTTRPSAGGKQPWDNPQERQQERLQKAVKTALEAVQ